MKGRVQIAEGMETVDGRTWEVVRVRFGDADAHDRRKVNLLSMLSWSFEFEGREYFEGFRSLSTNGIDKPILNLIRMTALMGGSRVFVQLTHAVPVEEHKAAGEVTYILKGAHVVERNNENALVTIGAWAPQMLLTRPPPIPMTLFCVIS